MREDKKLKSNIINRLECILDDIKIVPWFNINSTFYDYVLNHACALRLIQYVVSKTRSLSSRSSLPNGQLANEQCVLLINLPHGTVFGARTPRLYSEIYCTAEFNYSIILSQRVVAISKIHIQLDWNRWFDIIPNISPIARRTFNACGIIYPCIKSSRVDFCGVFSDGFF